MYKNEQQCTEMYIKLNINYALSIMLNTRTTALILCRTTRWITRLLASLNHSMKQLKNSSMIIPSLDIELLVSSLLTNLGRDTWTCFSCCGWEFLCDDQNPRLPHRNNFFYNQIHRRKTYCSSIYGSSDYLSTTHNWRPLWYWISIHYLFLFLSQTIKIGLDIW